jgi:SAM-dependent methyltransferase
MEFNIEDQRTFWNNRFEREGNVWGAASSNTARHAVKLFRSEGLKTLLVPGSGYGRNTKAFTDAGFTVTGIELSEVACESARRFNPEAKIFCRSVLDMSFDDTVYDVIYCFNTLHLFYEKERQLFLEQCNARLRQGGLMYFVVFSEKESSYGKNKKVEENTFESRPGRPTHYFTDEDIREHFQGFQVLETGIVEDEESHGEEGPHTHTLRYIVVRK